MTFRRVALLLVAATLATLLAACGSSSSTPPPAISVAFTSGSLPPASINTGSPGNTAMIAATVSNDSKNLGVSWSCTPASHCGSFSPASTLSGATTTYTAPTTVPAGGTVTITATSVADSTKSVSSSAIPVNQTSITVTFIQAPPSPLNIAAPNNTATIGVNVANDPQNAGVTWSCTPASICGGFSPTSTLSGATTTYTAPTSVPAGSTVTVKAASVTDPTAYASAAITITSNVTVGFTSAPPASVLIDSSTNLSATVGSDPNSAGVTWSCTAATQGAPCGSFTPTTTLSGANTSYTAPTAVPAGNTVTITATSVTDYTKSITSSPITVTSNITVAFTATYLPPASMNTNTEVQIAAYTTNDPMNAGVTWSCTPASQCGTFGQSPTLNNVTTAYTAPLTAPSGGSVTVTATSVSDFNQSKSANITITQPPATLPDGNYVFQLSGEDNDNFSAFYVAGAFTIQGGVIIGGEQNFVDSNYIGLDTILRQGSSSSTNITPTADGNVQVVLDTGDLSLGLGGLETFNVALVGSTSGLLTWFDGFAAGTGTISPQDPTAILSLPQSGYAFLTSGVDSGLAPVVMGGIINIDDLGGTTGTISGAGSVFDISDASAIAPQTNQLFAASTVTGPNSGSTPDKYGEVLFTLNPIGASGVPPIGLVGYIIDSNTIVFAEDTTDQFAGVTGGIALAQGANTGKFNTASLSSSTYVVGAQGQDYFFFLNFAAALTFNTDNSVSGTADFNDLTVASSGSITSGTYTVDTSGTYGTGRATISNLTGTDLNYDLNSNQALPATLQVYLDGNGNALVASMDSYDVTGGPAFKQAASSTFTGSYALGAVGVSTATGFFWSAAGPVSIGSGGAIGSSSFTDFNYFLATLPKTECGVAGPTCPGVPLTGDVGTGTITGLGADSILAPPLLSDTFDFYVIDNFRAFGIETDSTQLGLLYFQQPTPQPHQSQKRLKTRKP